MGGHRESQHDWRNRLSFERNLGPAPVEARTTTRNTRPLRSLSISDVSRNAPGSEDVFRSREDTSDAPLDAFDKELLAGGEINIEGNVWQSVKPSAPSTSFTTPSNSRTNLATTREELYAAVPAQSISSPSSCEIVLSPTLVALGSRRRRGNETENAPPLELDYLSSAPRKSSHSTISPRGARTSRHPASQIELGHAPPVVQGIPLVSVNDLPGRLRLIFPFPLFNAIQSKCFNIAYKTQQNLVLSAPTGSGKTVIMELAICNLKLSAHSGPFKIVYQSPTKALCRERCADWQAKFRALDLKCAELTGDTDVSQMRNVQAAQIIITTPEKWDSVTRRWKDHAKLMNLVRLFLIDEVHILKDSRGATLEAVVSRMKSAGSNVRFVALSATIPNVRDIARWLGRDSHNLSMPAHQEEFGEEFRPVQLQKVVYGFPFKSNEFVFDSMLESKLPGIIARHSQGKPILIFCPFRRSCVKTAKILAQLWTSTIPSERLWAGPRRAPGILDNDLRRLDVADRHAVEQAFLSHDVDIICCTSTLAVGVNLPCYLVIIKGTVAWTEKGSQEYADLEMMQMLGRAGRPQFEQSACAVILARQERVNYYNSLVSGKEPLESCLHLNLIDHLNAEIGLGTVSDLDSAKRWLGSTFLFVRLSQNPDHYRLKEDSAPSGEDDGILAQICAKDVTLLQEADLVTQDGKLSCTEFGDAMARYYVKFHTMRVLLSLPPRAKLSEILSAFAQAADFRDLRLKSGEKSVYKHINKDIGIKFPIKVDLALPAHKVSLLVQAELGGVDFPVGDQFGKYRSQFQQDKAVVFQHANRLARCIIDCQLSRGDSVSARHALELARSFAARVWENSPLQLKQLDQIGNVAVRKLANAGINCIELLENTEAHRLESVIGRGPPFGMKLLSKLAHFPKLRVSVKLIDKDSRSRNHVKILLKSEIGFLNEDVPLFFRKKPVYVCFLAETSDGRIVDFRRLSAVKLKTGHEVLWSVELTKPSQYVLCHAMCDEIAATCKSVELKPHLPQSLFPDPACCQENEGNATTLEKEWTSHRKQDTPGKRRYSETFDESGLDDRDLLAAESVETMDVDAFEDELVSLSARKGPFNLRGNDGLYKQRNEGDDGEKSRLGNGKWACNHRCKDKGKCKHLCCREGLEKPPKSSKKTSSCGGDNDTIISSIVDATNCSTSRWTSKGSTPSNNKLKKISSDNTPHKHQQPLSVAKGISLLEKLHQATTSPISSHAMHPVTARREWQQRGPSARLAASAEGVINENNVDEDVLDLDWVNAPNFEDAGCPAKAKDSRQGTSGSIKATSLGNIDPCESDVNRDNDLDLQDNDEVSLGSGALHSKQPMSPKNDTSISLDNPSDMGSKQFLSSQTVRGSSSSAAELVQAPDLLERDDGIYNFEPRHISTRLGRSPSKIGALDCTEVLNRGSSMSPVKELFFTSPTREKRWEGTSDALTATGIGSPDTSCVSHDMPNVDTMAVPATLTKISRSRPLALSIKEKKEREVADKVDDIAAEEDQGLKVARHKTRKNKNKRQQQKLLMDGIDPSFYDEFKDYVDFV